MADSWTSPPDVELAPDRVSLRGRALAADVASEPRTGLRTTRWRVGLAGGLAAVLVLAVVGLGPNGGPGGPAAAQAMIEVEVSGGAYEIRFVELAEGTQQVEAELAALGLDVTLDFVAVSPSLVGSLVATAGGGAGEVYVVEPGGVPRLSIPIVFEPSLALTIGRPALPGEAYVSSPALGAEAPGEALHCAGVFNMPAAAAAAVLAERGLIAEWRNERNEVTEVGTGYVVNATPKTAGEVIMWTASQPLPADVRPDHVVEFLSSGCEGAQS